MIEKDGQDDLARLSAYAPTKLVKNDVKNSSGFPQRLFAFSFATGLHALLLWWLSGELSLIRKSLPDEVVTVLEFLDSMPTSKPVEVLPDVDIRKRNSANPTHAVIASENSIKSAKAGISPDKKIANQPLRLFDDTGRIRLPVDFVEKLDEANKPGRRFDFINPDLELAGTFLKRPPAMEFNPTQFEDAWKPDQDILNELLEKAVEKTTKEIKIPVPGNPTVKLVCKVSVLALGGGCGFVPNGGFGRVVADTEDDPETLSPEEDKQCQAWWEKISGTRSHREWVKTTELYGITCKKPLAKEKVTVP